VEIAESWALALRTFSIRSTPATQLVDTIDMFSRAHELAGAHPNQAVLRYALMKMRNLKFTLPPHWRTVEALVLYAATVDASTLAVALAIISQNLAWGNKINKSALALVLESAIARHAPLGHGSEVAWSLWAAIQFEVGLSVETAKLVSDMEDDVVALLALDAESRATFTSGALEKTKWSKLIASPDASIEEHWLLAYEAPLKGWLPTPATKDPWFAELRKARISFYDTSTSQIGFSAATMTVPGGVLDPAYV
jgi:hypothetical protein